MTDLVRVVGKEDFGFQPYPSYYNVFNPLLKTNFAGVSAKQHFVYNFVGAALRTDIWRTRDLAGGPGEFQMVDAIDEGFEVIADGIGGRSIIDFNTINHYNQLNSYVEGIIRAIDSVGSSHQTCGFFDCQASNNPEGFDSACFANPDAAAFFELRTRDTSNNFTNTTVVNDTNWHRFNIELQSTNVKLSIEGTLGATSTTELPNVSLSPFMMIRSNSGQRTGRIRYIEAYAR